jgi:hypothetical protein
MVSFILVEYFRGKKTMKSIFSVSESDLHKMSKYLCINDDNIAAVVRQQSFEKPRNQLSMYELMLVCYPFKEYFTLDLQKYLEQIRNFTSTFGY